MALPNVLAPTARSRETLVLVQNTLATPWLPLIHALLNASTCTVVCVCVLHPSAAILPVDVQRTRMKIVDWTGCVPGYEGEGEEDVGRKRLSETVCGAVAEAPPGPVLLIVDSPDTLCADLSSPAQTYTLLKSWHTALASRPAPSRLLLPLPSRSPLLPLLTTPTFAPALAHLTLHPPALLTHLAASYLTLPPPHAPPARFWPLFTGLSERGEAERLVWGADGDGAGNEVVVEVLVRSATGKRTVDRTLEGWSTRGGACSLEALDALKPLWTKGQQQQETVAPDPTRDLPFNLTLTEAQQHARAQVPLPYAHEGEPSTGTAAAGAIFYDPDSADDIDEDDPDEDLDI